MSLRASECRLSDFQQHVQELELTKDTVDQLASRVDEAEKVLGAFQKHIQYLVEKPAEQSNQLLAKDAEVENEHERLSKREG